MKRVGKRAKPAAQRAASKGKTSTKSGEAVAVEDIDDEDDDAAEGKGFEQFPLTWNGVNFNVTAEGGRFYGSWRRTKFQRGNTAEQVPGFAIDIWCQYEGKHYTVESISYAGTDPRANMKSLNADICAAISGFLYRRVSGGMPSVEDLRKQAAHPLIHVNKIETIDRIILKLREFRDTAIRSGGQRIYSMRGDRDTDPELGISIDVTAAAIPLKGKVPSLSDGAIYDDVAAGLNRRGNTSKVVVNVPDAGNVKSLVERLKTADKGEARKIRGILRRMGHKGGARAVSKPAPATTSKKK